MGKSRFLLRFGCVPFSFQQQLEFKVQQHKLKKSLDGALWIQTWRSRMVGGDESTELWRPHMVLIYYY